MTTLSRLAKVIKGYTPPIGWIERAFASLANAVQGILPTYSISDIDNVLTVDENEGHEPVLEWKTVRQTPAVGTNDKGKYLHTNDSTGNLEWDAVRQTPAVGENDKDKYLHTNATTGALEWGNVASGSEDFVVTFSGDSLESTAACDKTWSEITAAYSAGKKFVCRYTDGDGGFYYANTALMTYDDTLMALVFCLVIPDMNGSDLSSIFGYGGSISSDDLIINIGSHNF